MYWLIGSIIGALVGYNLSGITFYEIQDMEAFALEFSGRGERFMEALGGSSANELKDELAMYVLGYGFLGMVIGGNAKPMMQKLKDVKKKCPNCAESIQKDAKFCRYCNHNL